MTTTVPTPAIFANRKAAALPERPVIATHAHIEPADPGKIVRPGRVDGVKQVVHDGICKAKHLQPGQRVRPFLHGEPRGSERVVGKVTRVEDGAYVEIEWASPHPTERRKAAYRFFDESLVGVVIERVVKVPGFVHYEEV